MVNKKETKGKNEAQTSKEEKLQATEETSVGECPFLDSDSNKS
ncbi:MAG: hypothetical protein QG646_2465, partial [Euryarchaeota archaeon]|nr:hypothetical protein [Euryarchaeota archaeon]